MNRADQKRRAVVEVGRVIGAVPDGSAVSRPLPSEAAVEKRPSRSLVDSSSQGQTGQLPSATCYASCKRNCGVLGSTSLT